MVQICNEFASYGRNFGNKLFTYSVSKIIADTYGYKLSVPENSLIQRGGILQEFPYKSTFGKIIESPNFYVSDGNMSDFGIEYIINSCEGHGVFMDGYFLRYDYIKSYKDKVIEYYSDLRISNDGKNDVIILLRDSNVDPTFKLCDEYYLDIFKKETFENLYVSLDHPNKHISLLEKLSIYNPIVLDLNIIDLFKYITKKNTILACQGTFSFWACLLSEANKIYWPLTKKGPNSIDKNVNLTVDDEIRYTFINLD